MLSKTLAQFPFYIACYSNVTDHNFTTDSPAISSPLAQCTPISSRLLISCTLQTHLQPLHTASTFQAISSNVAHYTSNSCHLLMSWILHTHLSHLLISCKLYTHLLNLYTLKTISSHFLNSCTLHVQLLPSSHILHTAHPSHQIDRNSPALSLSHM